MSNIEKIRAEIDRMLDDICEADGFVQKKDEPRYDALAEVLDFIDALEEQPDKSLEEAAMRYAIPAYMKDVDDNYLHEYPRDPIAEKAFIAGANWYKEQFEKNRLAYCDRMTEEEYDMETDFALGIIDKEHRQPTFIDAINYGMRLQKDALLEWAEERLAECREQMERTDISKRWRSIEEGYEKELCELIEKIKEDEK